MNSDIQTVRVSRAMAFGFGCSSQRKGLSRFWLQLGWIFIWSVLLLGSAARGAPGVALEWDANTEPVAGYRLHYGTASGVYTKDLDAGAATTARVPDLIAGFTYYFAVTAYNAGGLESLPSNEVSVIAPWPAGLAASSLPEIGLPGGQPAGIKVTPRLTSERDFSLRISGTARMAVTVAASFNLQSWEVLGSVVNPTGEMLITDLHSREYPERYYRVTQIEVPD